VIRPSFDRSFGGFGGFAGFGGAAAAYGCCCAEPAHGPCGANGGR
jgi:hypothetical protein